MRVLYGLCPELLLLYFVSDFVYTKIISVKSLTLLHLILLNAAVLVKTGQYVLLNSASVVANCLRTCALMLMLVTDK